MCRIRRNEYAVGKKGVLTDDVQVAAVFAHQVLFYIGIVEATETNGYALPPGTACTADTVHIGFRLRGHVVIDDQVQFLHIDAA